MSSLGQREHLFSLICPAAPWPGFISHPPLIEAHFQVTGYRLSSLRQAHAVSPRPLFLCHHINVCFVHITLELVRFAHKPLGKFPEVWILACCPGSRHWSAQALGEACQLSRQNPLSPGTHRIGLCLYKVFKQESGTMVAHACNPNS